MKDSTPSPPHTKRCTKCGHELPATLEFFGRITNHGKPGLRPACKQCAAAAGKLYGLEHKEEIRQYNSKYYQSHKEEILARNKNWMVDNKERRLAYREQYRLENADAIHHQQREHNKARYAADPKKWIIYARNRDVRKKGNGGTHTAADIQAQHARQKGRCFWCKKKLDKYHVDHVIPLALGGHNGPENLVVACSKCNRTKHAKHPMDFAGVMF